VKERREKLWLIVVSNIEKLWLIDVPIRQNSLRDFVLLGQIIEKMRLLCPKEVNFLKRFYFIGTKVIDKLTTEIVRNMVLIMERPWERGCSLL